MNLPTPTWPLYKTEEREDYGGVVVTLKTIGESGKEYVAVRAYKNPRLVDNAYRNAIGDLETYVKRGETE